MGGGIQVIFGVGGNIAVSAGSDGVFVIDDQYANTAAANLAKVEEIANGAPRYLLNTHWHSDHAGGNETFAKAVGLPDVIAHGMYTQAQLGTLLVELAGGDPGRILSFSLRFSAPVVVANDGGAELELRAEVVAVEEGVASVSMTARSAGVDVVKDAVATLRVA